MPTALHQTFPLTGPINLFVRIAHGSVTVEPRDDLTEASVVVEQAGERPADGADAADTADTADTADAPIAAVLRGPTLHIVTPRESGLFDLFGRGRAGELHVHAVVPTGTAVKIVTHDAPITVTGRVSGADLAFGRGTAELEQVDGDLRLRFGQGSVHAARVGGSVHVRSGAGAVRLGEVGGDLKAGCGSGDLTVDVVRGTVQGRAGSGAARLGAVHGDVDLASGSGPMEIGLPTGRAARVDVQTGSGQVRCELPVEQAPQSPTNAISVRARTGHGDVRLYRAGTAA